MCIHAVERTYREREHEDDGNASTGHQYFEYKRYKANDGVHPLAMKKAQAAYLDSLSLNAILFYLAFTHVDGTDGIANGIGRHILSYVGMKKSVYNNEG
jgi:hypothetical protein